jgi:hypothetical protein
MIVDWFSSSLSKEHKKFVWDGGLLLHCTIKVVVKVRVKRRPNLSSLSNQIVVSPSVIVKACRSMVLDHELGTFTSTVFNYRGTALPDFVAKIRVLHKKKMNESTTVTNGLGRSTLPWM